MEAMGIRPSETHQRRVMRSRKVSSFAEQISVMAGQAEREHNAPTIARKLKYIATLMRRVARDYKRGEL